MKSNSCWTLLNGPKAFGWASDWIGQWFIQHPSKLSVSDWNENYRVSEISQPLRILTNTVSQPSKSTSWKSNALPSQLTPAAFTLNLTSTQSCCKGHAVGAVSPLGVQLINTANPVLLESWKENRPRYPEVRWNLDNCSLVYMYIPPTEPLCDK